MGMPGLVEKLKIEYAALKNRREIKKLHGEFKSIDLIEFLGMQSGQMQLKKEYYPEHPKFQEHVNSCLEKIKGCRANLAPSPVDGKIHVTMSLGDSIVAFSEKELAGEIDLNFNLPGDSGPGFHRVLEAVGPSLKGGRGKPQIVVDYLVVGCWVGNGLLNFQDYQWALREFQESWDKIRARLPGTRFITYGLPPTYNLYASSVRFDFNYRALYEKVLSDGNATVTMLQKGYAGFLGLFPTMEMSYDTVHLTERGKYLLRDDIKKGKRAPAGTILD